MDNLLDEKSLELLEEKEGSFELDELMITKDDDSMPYNRIISKDVSEYHFIIPQKKRVEIGEIFSIEDREITFLARITDIQHDSNYDGNWDTIIRGTNFYDEDHIFSRVIAEPLGCIIKEMVDEEDKKTFKKSRTIPSKFSSVKKAGTNELEFLRDVNADIEVGRLRNGSQKVEDIPVALHSEAMDHHVGIFATTGMGKSNFMKVFAASCIKKSALKEWKFGRFGLLIVDPHGEYLYGGGRGKKGLLDLNTYEDGLICYSTDKERAKRSHGSVSELKIDRKDIIPEDTYILYEWRDAQKEILEIIPYIFGEDTWIDDIQKYDNQKGDNELKKFSHLTIDVVQRRIESICRNYAYINPPGRTNSSIPNIISRLKEGKVVLIDIPNLNERGELFLLSVLSRHILDSYRMDASRKEEKNRCLITIEEAQRVLGGGGGSLSRFESIAREGRKFGVGLCAITQQPKLVDKQLLSQFNTFVILGLSDRNDRTRLEESAKQDLSSLDVEIQTLETGEAIISTLKIPFPVPARIHSYEDYLGDLNNEKRDDKMPNQLSRAPL